MSLFQDADIVLVDKGPQTAAMGCLAFPMKMTYEHVRVWSAERSAQSSFQHSEGRQTVQEEADFY